jgi:hypothetical protein
VLGRAFLALLSYTRLFLSFRKYLKVLQARRLGADKVESYTGEPMPVHHPHVAPHINDLLYEDEADLLLVKAMEEWSDRRSSAHSEEKKLV